MKLQNFLETARHIKPEDYYQEISILVKKGWGRIEISKHMQKKYNMLAQDARGVISTWQLVHRHQIPAKTMLNAEAGAGGAGGGGAAGGTGGATGGATGGDSGAATSSSGDGGSADSGGADTGDSTSTDSTPTPARSSGFFWGHGLRPSKNSTKKKKKKKKSSNFSFGKGVYERKDMPQIKESDLEDNSISYKKGVIKTENIIPMQKDRSKKMGKKAFEKFENNTYDHLIVDKNNKLINGHHRLDVAIQLEKQYVRAIKVDATLESLMKKFAHTTEDIKTRTKSRNYDVFKNPDKRRDTGMLDVMVPDRSNLEPEWDYNSNQSPIENFNHWFQEKRRDPDWKYSDQESWSIFKDKYEDMMQ